LEPTYGSQQRGRRPCLILTDDAINVTRRTVGVIPLSSSPNVAPPLVVAIPSLGGNSVALCDQLRAFDKSKVNKRIAEITVDEMALIEASVKTVFGLS
jgi:mRNA interferase MazF